MRGSGWGFPNRCKLTCRGPTPRLDDEVLSRWQFKPRIQKHEAEMQVFWVVAGGARACGRRSSASANNKTTVESACSPTGRPFGIGCVESCLVPPDRGRFVAVAAPAVRLPAPRVPGRCTSIARSGCGGRGVGYRRLRFYTDFIPTEVLPFGGAHLRHGSVGL